MIIAVSRPGPARTVALVALAALTMMVVNGASYGGFWFLDPELLKSLNVSHGDLKLRDAFTFGATAIFSPVGGWLIDSRGLRTTMALGLGLLALMFFLASQVTSIGELYAVYILMGLAVSFCASVPSVILASRVTMGRRGIAIGVLTAGQSLGNAFFPQFNAALLDWTDWRGVLQITAIFPLLLILANFVLVPSSVSRGRVAGEPGMAPPHPSTASLRGALAERRFWLLGVAAGLTLLSLMALSSNLVLFLVDEKGVSRAGAANAQSLFFLAGLISQLLAGMLADRISVVLVQILATACMALGGAILAFGPAGIYGLGIGVFGVGWGAAYATLQLLGPALFPGPVLGRVMAAIVTIETATGALGPWAAGAVYDATGHYRGAFVGVAIASALAALSTAMLYREIGHPSRHRRLPALH